MLFLETNFEEVNIKKKPLIWSHDKIVMKFGPKKWVELGFGQSARELPENQEKVLFYETYFEESNINRKSLIWSHYKIITKFRLKKWVSFVLGNVYKKLPKD